MLTGLKSGIYKIKTCNKDRKVNSMNIDKQHQFQEFLVFFCCFFPKFFRQKISNICVFWSQVMFQRVSWL
jgi:hypothetical protein